MRLTGNRLRIAAAAGAALAAIGVVALATATSSAAGVSFVDIGSPSGPLTHVDVGADLSCQDSHSGDTSYEFYPPMDAPGDCGTLVALGGALYAPDFSADPATATGDLNGGNPYTNFTEVTQTPKTGSGTSSSPYSVTTTVTLGTTGVTLIETDTYVTGQELYKTSVTITTTSATAQSLTLFHGGDCYLQNSDLGFGATGPLPGEILCSQNAYNVPSGRILGFAPLTPGSHYVEAHWPGLWQMITQAGTQFPDTCVCTLDLDNTAGLSWPVSVSAAAPATVSFESLFSPTGNAGGGPTPTPTPTPTVTPTATPTPSPTSVPVPGTGAGS